MWTHMLVKLTTIRRASPSAVRRGIAGRQCLVFRFAMAPLPAWTVMNMGLT
jgi:hypothetical protein